MSQNFEDGVARYVIAHATVEVGFPVDFKGNAYICCEQCFFYRSSTNRCGLNMQVCEFPKQYIGGRCPLEIETAETGEI